MQADKQEQIRTIHQSRKGLKRGQGLVLRSRTQETLRVELPRDLDYNTQRLCACYILIE
jgi:hypothetical protein